MNDIREWALMLVFISLAGFIYWYLLPSGRISETAKQIFSVLCVTAVCVPLFSAAGHIGTAIPFFIGSGEDESMYSPTDYYAEIAKETVREKLSLIIKKYTAGDFSIRIDMNITDDACIDIKQVSVIFETYPDNLAELSGEIESALGIAPSFERKENDDA